MRLRLLLSIIVLPLLTGCVSIGDINDGFRRVDRVWQLEYQKAQDEFRFKVVEAPYDVTMRAVYKAFLDLDMPARIDSGEKGLVVAESKAPKPLSFDEWKNVAKEENPRVKEIGGWFLEMPDVPDGYIVELRATLMPIDEKHIGIMLDYRLDNPEYRRMGVVPSKFAPPTAVQLGTAKFWTALANRLSEVSALKPRKRNAP